MRKTFKLKKRILSKTPYLLHLETNTCKYNHFLQPTSLLYILF